MSTEKKEKWYKKWWIILLVWPVFLLIWISQLIWKQKWDKKYRLAVLVLLWGFIWINVIISVNEDKKLQSTQSAWKCIGPDGKEIGLSPQSCDEFNRAWKEGTSNTPSIVDTEVPTIVELKSTPKESKSYPSLDDEVMDKDFLVKCGEGLNGAVFLLDKPTDIEGGVRSKARVSCSATGYAFNTYHNKELNKTFYAVNLDGGGATDPHYGWMEERFLYFSSK